MEPVKKHWGLWVALLGCMLLAVFLLLPRSSPVTSYKTGYCCDTLITLTLVGNEEEENQRILEQAYRMCLEYEETVLDRFLPTSEVGVINASQAEAKDRLVYGVSDSLRAVLALGILWGRRTEGAFDITIAPCSDLWKVTNRDFQVPTPEQIKQAVSLVDISTVLLDGEGVTPEIGQQFDFGGLAKGYLCQKLYEYFDAAGVNKAVVNFGGNVCVLGDSKVGIQNPFGGEPIQTVTLSQGFVSTAGIYERGIEVDGTWYHHIIDPRTGSPAETDVVSATVVTSDATAGSMADIVSTTCVVLGKEKAMEFLDGLWEQDPRLSQVIFVLQDQSVVIWTPEGV